MAEIIIKDGTAVITAKYGVIAHKVKTKPIIDAMINKAKTAISTIELIGNMKDEGIITGTEMLWLGKYLGVFCWVRRRKYDITESRKEEVYNLFLEQSTRGENEQ